MGVHTVEMITELPLNFIYSKKKGKISLKPLKEKENGHHNQIWVWESIVQGEDISTPHICYTQREPFS